jgi:hypothetical protein
MSIVESLANVYRSKNGRSFGAVPFQVPSSHLSRAKSDVLKGVLG